MVTREEIRRFVDGLSEEERDELASELERSKHVQPEPDQATASRQALPESSFTWADLVRLFVEGPPRDPDFADDLEAIHDARPIIELRDWSS